MASQALRSLNLRAARRSPFGASSSTTTITTRTFASTPATRFASKGTQDRESLNPSSNEGTKSGDDSEAAHVKGAFDPSTTRPGKERKEANGNTLDVSGANQEVSKPQGDNPNGKGGTGKGAKKGGKSSGGASTPKGGKA
ncbi:hypothetical protein EsH8_II_001284 [Colletotrichum jinshuiense]